MILETSLAKKLPLVIKLGPVKVKNFLAFSPNHQILLKSYCKWHLIYNRILRMWAPQAKVFDFGGT